MKLLHLLLPTLLSHAASTAARAAPVARQLTRPSDPSTGSLAQRQAPSVSGPSTLTTATSTATATDPDTTATTPTSTTPTATPTATPTGPRNHNIAVGQNGTQFTPTVAKNIPIGDTLTFYFYPQNYSIIQSSFNSPCTPIKLDGVVDQRALFSGFHPTLNSSSIAPEKFVLTVKSTESMWIYAMDGTQLATSTEKTVCERGMVMVINPPAKGETLKSYQKSAAALDGNDKDVDVDVHQCPADVWGGEVIALSERQRAHWLGRHPLGGNVKNGTTSGGGGGGAGSAYGNGSGTGGNVQSYQNGAERAMFGRGNSLMAVAVFVGASVFGLAM
ncbi:hypothetical protein LTR70_004139 [Exophiala xenobiotica]|uniref:Uncharacterized protein n=1 Tax=Lithohypha guttulata TaxID=1690604 RepID=A0ABR0KEE8_9EURO|nr:hypothetical protein LTR24_003579 [Lithohypha guttulata]KAK5321584.1 hypothetical protein LTR70_004139 [Exophiala xenobiotica]